MSDDTDDKKKKKRKSRLLSLPLLLIALGSVAMLGKSAMMVLIGMLPSVAAGLTDRSPNRFRVKSVAAMNFSGLAPYIMELSRQGNLESVARDMMGNGVMWLTVYSAAAVGWCIVWLAPMTARHIMLLYAQMKAEQLEEVQQKYVEEWGDEVKNWPPQ